MISTSSRRGQRCWMHLLVRTVFFPCRWAKAGIPGMLECLHEGTASHPFNTFGRESRMSQTLGSIHYDCQRFAGCVLYMPQKYDQRGCGAICICPRFFGRESMRVVRTFLGRMFHCPQPERKLKGIRVSGPCLRSNNEGTRSSRSVLGRCTDVVCE